MKHYCAIETRHKPGKYAVFTIGPMGDFHIVGGIRYFDTFEEANIIARNCANGFYPDLCENGQYVNMR